MVPAWKGYKEAHRDSLKFGKMRPNKLAQGKTTQKQPTG